MTRISLIAVAALAVAGAGAALAHEKGDRQARGGGEAFFETVDANADGTITTEEFEAHRAARFAEIDTDGNGLLSADELAARGEAQKSERMERRINRMMERADADGDGALSQDELEQVSRRGDPFARMDSDGDGSITRAEFDEARADMGEHRRGHGKRGDKPAE